MVVSPVFLEIATVLKSNCFISLITEIHDMSSKKGGFQAGAFTKNWINCFKKVDLLKIAIILPASCIFSAKHCSQNWQK